MLKSAKGLVEYAKAQIGNPYWYGTFGQLSSEALYNQKKSQYPKMYTASDYKSQYGKKVHDCIGLIKGYIWCDGIDDTSPEYQSNGCPDINEEMMYDNAKVKGDISTMPEKKGLLVFKSGHVGVYIGNGYVVEAKGHAYGVVKTKLKDRNFTRWCECPYIVYEKEKATKYVTVNTNKSGLNCRKRPRLTAKIICTFKKSQKLRLIEKTNKRWYKVTDGKNTGYCYKKWLKEV